VSVALNRS